MFTISDTATIGDRTVLLGNTPVTGIEIHPQGSIGTSKDLVETWGSQKLGVARSKLSLANPVMILIQQVQMNPNLTQDPNLLKSILQVLKNRVKDSEMGDSLEGERIQAPMDPIDQRTPTTTTSLVYCSSVESQVRSLVKLAQDPSILARTFRGWEPYL